MEKAAWTIPAARMKMDRDHRVPLSPRAMEILAGQTKDHTGLVFPAPRGGTLSDGTLNAVIRRMSDIGDRKWLDPKSGRIAVAHGFRSTFRDWASERTNYPRDVAEMALAHSIGDKVEAAYRRGDLFEKRRRMMSDWAAFCAKVEGTGSVVPLHKKA